MKLNALDVAVIKQMGYNPKSKSDMEDVKVTLGSLRRADDGYTGFIYPSENEKFVKKNKAKILELAKQYAQDFGSNTLSVIVNFDCLKRYGVTEEDVAEVIYANKKKNPNWNVIIDALAWFALEQTAWKFQK